MLIHGHEVVVDPPLRERFDGLRAPRDVIARWGAALPPADRRSAVVEVALPEGRFFLKVYAYAGLWRLRTVFIVARARREYLNLKRMAGFGFRVPEAVAYGQSRTAGFLSESFVMTRAVENAIELRRLADDPACAPFPLPPPAERRRLVVEFARTLRRAHDAGFYVHTLRTKNLLLSREADGRYALTVIDVPFAGIWRYRLFPSWGRVRDLAVLMRGTRTLLSRTDRLRFARAYGADRKLLRKALAYQESYYPLE